jgi:hypothetical protein
MARHRKTTIEMPRELPDSLRADARVLGVDPSHLSKVRRGLRLSVSLSNRDQLLQQLKKERAAKKRRT